MKETSMPQPVAIDLHLPSGTLWADRNIGADNESLAGIYLAWGETADKDSYFLSNYKFWQQVEVGEHEEPVQADGDDNQVAEVTDGETRIVKDYAMKMVKYTKADGLRMLQTDDDAASVNLGADWCLPSADQWQELFDECDKRIETEGIRFSRDGASILIPIAGICHEGLHPYDQENDGYYLSCTGGCRNDEDFQRAVLSLAGRNISLFTDAGGRIAGYCARAVRSAR